jgi:hypothetical protein
MCVPFLFDISCYIIIYLNITMARPGNNPGKRLVNDSGIIREPREVEDIVLLSAYPIHSVLRLLYLSAVRVPPARPASEMEHSSERIWPGQEDLKDTYCSAPPAFSRFVNLLLPYRSPARVILFIHTLSECQRYMQETLLPQARCHVGASRTSTEASSQAN